MERLNGLSNAVTNKTNEKLSNVRLEAINTNAIYYNYITYQEDVNAVMKTRIKYAEDKSLNSKIVDRLKMALKIVK